MKTFAMLLITWLMAANVFSQTSLQGTVTDADNGQAIIFGTVAIYKNGVLITGTETDLDGYYSITEIDPGIYEVLFSYTGYQELKIGKVEVIAGRANKLDAKMSAGVTLTEIVVTYERPVIQQDNTTQGSVMSFNKLADRGYRNNSKKNKKNKSGNTNSQNQMAATPLPVRPSGTIVQKQLNLNNKGNIKNNSDPKPETNEFNTEDYTGLPENEFKSPLHDPLSTFSIDVDKAAYSNIRRYLNNNQMPPPDAVRIEEILNYFQYSYDKPKNGEAFSVKTELAACPWNEGNLLLQIGLKGREMDMKNAPPSNLTFLLDVSGSMQAANKLDLVKPAMTLLVKQLREKDRVAIVVYAGAAGLVLPATPGNEQEKILEAIHKLQAGGSTAGGAGIQLAYKIAQENFIENGNNRVILATDGDFNVGISSDGDLTRLIEEKRKEGIFLTALGFGMGNYKDNKLEILADKGNGNYAYIDNLLEAKKAFVTDLTGTLFVIAKDVKLQLEFNPNIVEAYRLIGYENRILAKEDFNDDTKDAGEIGAGHFVTALYEIVPKRREFDFPGEKVDPLKYQSTTPTAAAESGEVLTLKLRYKQPGQGSSQLLTHSVEHRWTGFPEASADFQWAAAVAGFGMLLRESKFAGDFSFEKALEIGKASQGNDKHGYRAECLKLMEAAELLSESRKAAQAEKR